MPDHGPHHGNTEYLSKALLESRERWRDFAMLANDFAFETDAAGLLSFFSPADAFGYPENSLLGTSGVALLADTEAVALFNPFRPTRNEMRRHVWLRDATGNVRCFAVSVRQLVDVAGTAVGARGVAQDITTQSEHDTAVAGALRRGELLEHIMWRMRQEVLAPRMMQAILEALMNALGAGGVVLLNAVTNLSSESLLHAAGTTPHAVLDRIADAAAEDSTAASILTSREEHSVLICPSYTRFGESVILGLWRDRFGRPWDSEDSALASSITAIVGVVLEHETIQREMAHQARTDPLTGLLNRRAFFEGVERRIGRSERDGLSSVLMYIDLDHFKWINDVLGHEAGDDALCRFGAMLRSIFRPADLVARLGGDEFAVWMDGSDQFTAAERAEQVRIQAKTLFRHFANGQEPEFGTSIGMACRAAFAGEGVDSVMRRADTAMYQAKRDGRGCWLVSADEPIG